jgi:tetratricopeptide (TPR) repeat protein
MAVTLPPLLLLLDYWPLCRTNWRSAVLEKVPLLLMAIFDAWAVFVAQSAGRALVASQQLPITTRCANALLAYVAYIGKLLIPTDLAVFYPYSVHFSAGAVLAAAAALAAASVAAFLVHRRYIAVGWFWFLGTLVPVIGIVQVGSQSMADRYSYVPSIGLFILGVWWAGDVLEKSRFGRKFAAFLVVAVICLFTALARLQVQFWRNTESLFIHAAAVAPENWVADMELGNIAFDRGDLSTAAGDFSQVIRLRPQDARGYNNLANCMALYNLQKAIALYQKAVELDPSSLMFQKNLAAAHGALQERNAAEKMHTE